MDRATTRARPSLGLARIDAPAPWVIIGSMPATQLGRRILVAAILLIACPRAPQPADEPAPSPRESWISDDLQVRDLSGLAFDGDRLLVARNRPGLGQTAQIYALRPGADDRWAPVGQWSLLREDGPWVDAEAITPSGRGTALVLVESLGGDGAGRIWEVSLPVGEGTVPVELHRQWRLPEAYREVMGAGSEAMTRVPAPADLPSAEGELWVLVGHQARASIGLFRLSSDAADPNTPIEAVRELATDFDDTSGMDWQDGSLFLWHNENLPTLGCRSSGARVNVLERYSWSAASTPTELRGSRVQWKHPQPGDAPCRNLEGLALGRCEGGVRTVYLVDDDAAPAAGARYEVEGLCGEGP